MGDFKLGFAIKTFTNAATIQQNTIQIHMAVKKRGEGARQLAKQRKGRGPVPLGRCAGLRLAYEIVHSLSWMIWGVLNKSAWARATFPFASLLGPTSWNVLGTKD